MLWLRRRGRPAVPVLDTRPAAPRETQS
jgi:hypothetical protein